ncbi:MAG: hypothetical protein AABY15_06075 [Nanoarchaeota archaeon]
MKKSDKKTNILIKEKLINEIRKSGIKRINPASIIFLDAYILNRLKKIFKAVKEEIRIYGKKTINPEDIKKVLDEVKKENSFEV